jgi:hypothetical protein
MYACEFRFLTKESTMTRSASALWNPAPAMGNSATPRPSVRGGHRLENSSVLAGMLLAAALAAVLVVADQVINTWTDGHLLAGWVALWTLVFAVLAMLASPLRQLAAGTAALISRQLHRVQLQRSEARMWEYAVSDPRTMADIRLLKMRGNDGL